MILGGQSRRFGKAEATRRWVAVQREHGTHAHLIEREHSGVPVCLNGQCADLPHTTTEENES